MKTNIIMVATYEQLVHIQKILEDCIDQLLTVVYMSNKRYYKITIGDGGEFFEEVDADLFIRTNGTCEEPKCAIRKITKKIKMGLSEDETKSRLTFEIEKSLSDLENENFKKEDIVFMDDFNEGIHIAEYRAKTYSGPTSVRAATTSITHPHADPFERGARVEAWNNGRYVGDADYITYDERVGHIVILLGHIDAVDDVKEKPQRRTVTMPDGTVLPEPVREALAEGKVYWVPDNTITVMVNKTRWRNDFIDDARLERGLIHRTEEDARAWAEYLLKLTKVV